MPDSVEGLLHVEENCVSRTINVVQIMLDKMLMSAAELPPEAVLEIRDKTDSVNSSSFMRMIFSVILLKEEIRLIGR